MYDVTVASLPEAVRGRASVSVVRKSISMVVKQSVSVSVCSREHGLRTLFCSRSGIRRARSGSRVWAWPSTAEPTAASLSLT